MILEIDPLVVSNITIGGGGEGACYALGSERGEIFPHPIR